MRGVECPCGEYIEADGDDRLLEAAKAHSQDAHQDRYSETELKVLIDTAAYDVGEPA